MPSPMDFMQEQHNQIILQLTSLTSVAEDVKSIKSDVNSLKALLEMAHESINNFSSTIKSLESRVAKAEEVANEVPQLRAEIARLNQELDDRDQWARANNVEIRGIPQKKTENLCELAQKIGSLCNFSIKKKDINYIARVPTRLPNAEKPIIISFNNRYTKEELVSSSRKTKLSLSDLGFTASGLYYVNDHLTQRNKGLLSRAKSLARDNNFKYIWSHLNIIFKYRF